MAILKTREDVRDWLKGQPREVAIVFAARVALRVTPLLNNLFLSKLDSADVQAIILPLFYSKATTLFDGRWPNRAVEAVTAIAYAADVAAHAAADVAAATAAAAYLAADAAPAYAAYAAADAAYAAAADVAYANAATATAANAAYAAANFAAKFWHECTRDYEFIIAGGTASALADEPLWADGWQGAPETILQDWQKLKRRLLDAKQGWEVWTDWYEDRLIGGWAKDGPDLELAKLNYLSKHHKDGPAVVNAELLRLTDQYNPPILPDQDDGPIMGIDDEDDDPVIIQIPDPDYDNESDWDTLRALQPELEDVARDFVNVLGGGANAFPTLSKLANKYLSYIERAVDDIPFAQLAALGMRFANAEAAAKRDISDRLRPQLEDDQKEALESLLDIHGAFILSTREGSNLVLKAERYSRNSEADQHLREESRALVTEMSKENIISTNVAEILEEAADLIDQGDQAERGTVYGSQAIRNVVGVTVSSGYFSVVGGLVAIGGPIGIGIGSLMAVIGTKGLRDSKIGKEWSELIAKLMDKSTELTESDLKQIYASSYKFKKFADFILKHEQRLRSIAGTRREFAWLHKQIDWLKRNYPKK